MPIPLSQNYNPNFNYKGKPNYGYPDKKDQLGVLIGTLLGAGMGAATGNNLGDSLLRGTEAGIYSYGTGLDKVQDYNTGALQQQGIADRLLYEPEQQEMERGMYDLSQKKYDQSVREYEEVDKPYKKAATEMMTQRPEALKKEFNIPGDLDTFLASKSGKYGLDYSNPEHRMKMLGLYGSNNTGLSRQYAKWKTDVSPQIHVLAQGYQGTSGKPVSFDVRKGKLSENPKDIQKTPSEADVKFEREYTTADVLLDSLEQAFEENEKALPNNAYERITEYPSRVLGKALQTEAGVGLKNLQQLTDATKSKLIRSLGEVGTLTDVDIKRVSSAMASINDVKSVREHAIKQLRKLIGDIHSRGARQSNILPGEKTTTIEGKPKTAEEYLMKFK